MSEGSHNRVPMKRALPGQGNRSQFGAQINPRWVLAASLLRAASACSLVIPASRAWHSKIRSASRSKSRPAALCSFNSDTFTRSQSVGSGVIIGRLPCECPRRSLRVERLSECSVLAPTHLMPDAPHVAPELVVALLQRRDPTRQRNGLACGRASVPALPQDQRQRYRLRYG